MCVGDWGRETGLWLHSPVLSVFTSSWWLISMHKANAIFCLWETSLCVRACLALGCLQPVAGQALLPSCGELGPHHSGGTGDHLAWFWARAIRRSPTQLQKLKSQFALHWPLCLQQAGAGIVPTLHKTAGRESRWGEMSSSVTHPTGTAHLDTQVDGCFFAWEPSILKSQPQPRF